MTNLTQHYTRWEKAKSSASKIEGSLSFKENVQVEKKSIVPICRWFDLKHKDLKDSTSELLYLITFSKVAGYKNPQKNQAAFLYTSNKLAEKQTWKISLMTASKKKIPKNIPNKGGKCLKAFKHWGRNQKKKPPMEMAVTKLGLLSQYKLYQIPIMLYTELRKEFWYSYRSTKTG